MREVTSPGCSLGAAQPLEKSPGIDLCNLWQARYAFGNLLKATKNLRIIPTYTHRPTQGLRLSALYPGDTDESQGSRGHRRQALHDRALREAPLSGHQRVPHREAGGGARATLLASEPLERFGEGPGTFRGSWRRR